MQEQIKPKWNIQTENCVTDFSVQNVQPVLFADFYYCSILLRNRQGTTITQVNLMEKYHIIVVT